VWGRWRRRQRLGRIRAGDGSLLDPFGGWDVLTRSLFYLELPDADPDDRVWAVDVHHFAEEDSAELYRGRRQSHRSTLPAAFPVPGGVIEVDASTYGLSRMHFVADDGRERPLQPHRWSLEGLRARFGRRFPRVSEWVGRVAVLVLLVGLAVGLPQAAAMISRTDLVADAVGTFTSPITLPGWLNTTLVVAGVLAGLERALMLRNHWLIDADTWWMDD